MAAEEKQEEATIETQAAAPEAAADSGKSNKLLLPLTLVNMVATLGMVAVLLISFQKDKKKPQISDISAHEEHAEGKKDEHGGGGEGGEHGGESKSDKKKVGKEFGKKIPLEQFTVNLSNSGSVNPKFARVAIVLEVQNDDLEGEVTQKMAQVRNAIIDLFNSKKPTDLSTTEGKNYLKEEIRNALNSFLVTGKISGVYFTNFAVSG